jgi:hypothetical protein
VCETRLVEVARQGIVLHRSTGPATRVFEWGDVGLMVGWHDVVPLPAHAMHELHGAGEADGHLTNARDLTVTGEVYEVGESAAD